MITIESNVNKQIAKNLSLDGMDVTKEQQKQILDVINNKKKVTNEVIRKIAYKIMKYKTTFQDEYLINSNLLGVETMNELKQLLFQRMLMK